MVCVAYFAKGRQCDFVKLVHHCTHLAISIQTFSCDPGDIATLVCVDTVTTILIIVVLRITNGRFP